ncbi:Activator of Hsp90 ATPase homolog 1-like protein [Rhodococcus gordoniae]|uniref:Activator of Hsp90 ATPase homolog 1-like protein n=1 Tax=Rhodococcus gordoniae TaxID=223392 RepID=A0A379LY41_9NOCA|nr:SRPBCC family protein [Rhodococcus gordoniae]UTT47662.1 SRPBCC family protein [Rhodococcus gordoniae]SUE14994.1 Activator of Hsp90 ATPase homolog 1-like protein [Rhodococcus gordoniae]
MSNALTLSVPEGVPFIDYEREFDFPVADVFRAHKDPDLVARWLGPRGMKIEIEQFDFRTGGSYRYRHSDERGSYRFAGVFHTVRDNEFVVQTFEYLGFPDVVSLETLTFVDLGDGRCKLVGHSVYPSTEARDGMAQSGMETGLSEGFEQLDEALAQETASR